MADGQGGVLPGVTVTLRNVESGTVRTTASETSGQYRLAGLQPGRYALHAELDGFQPADVANLTLTIGLNLQQNLTMALRGVQEAITVTAQSPVVETTTTEVATVVTQEQIEMLPIANRQAGSLALLLPGTQLPTGTRRARPTVGAGGANANLTTSYVDGGQNQIYNSGQEFLEVPQSGIREFRVNISGGSAQYSAIGGVVLTATKSGTNEFHGEAFEFFRDTSLNRMDKFEQEAHDTTGEPKPEYRRNQYRLRARRPHRAQSPPFLRRVRAHERAEDGDRPHGTAAVLCRRRRQLPGRVRTPADAAAGRPAGQQRAKRVSALPVGQEIHVLRGMWRLDGRQHRDRYRLAPRFAARSAHVGDHPARPERDPIAATPLASREPREPPGIPRWPASQRGEFPPERFEDYTGVYIFPSLTWGSTGYSNNNTDRWDISDDVTLSMGNHNLKSGAAYLSFRSNEESAHNIGTWTFGQDQFFDGSEAAIDNLRNAIQYTESFPPLPRDLQADWIQAYVQDEWKVRSNVTLDIGLRYREPAQGVQPAHHVRRTGTAAGTHRSARRATTTTTGGRGSAWPGT